MKKEIYLTGITTTGTPHIGNYVGAIRPGILASMDRTKDNFIFSRSSCSSEGRRSRKNS